MKHKYFEKQVQIVNPETGEITGTLESEKKFVYNVESDNFFMTFINFMSPMFKLKGDNAKNILSWMCANAEYNTGKVYLTSSRIAELSQTLEMPKQSVYNSLVELKKLNLISGERGSFQINPEIFWKGELSARRQLINSNNNTMSVTFSIAQEEYDSHK